MRDSLLNGKVYRGQRPRSFSQLEGLGVTDVINLQSGAHEFFHNDPYEFEKAQDFGMQEHNILCSDITPPKESQMLKVSEIIKNAKGNVYIHCLHGKDRTGFTCAYLRMTQEGWSFSEAREEMFSKGFHKVPYLWWVFS